MGSATYVPRQPVDDPTGALARLAARLRELREHAGLSQQRLADELHVNRSTIVAIERAWRRATLEDVIRIAAVLRVPLGELLGDEISTDDYQLGFEDGYRKALGEVTERVAALRQTGAE